MSANLQEVYDEVYAKHLEMKDRIDKKREELLEAEMKARDAFAEQKANGQETSIRELTVTLAAESAKLTLVKMEMEHNTRERTLQSIEMLINGMKK